MVDAGNIERVHVVERLPYSVTPLAWYNCCINILREKPPIQ